MYNFAHELGVGYGIWKKGIYIYIFITITRKSYKIVFMNNDNQQQQ